jgi:hypothetical protein
MVAEIYREIGIKIDRQIIGASGDLPTPPYGHPSREGIFHASFLGIVCKEKNDV